MTVPLPLVLVPGLLCSARLYGPQVAALWPCGPIMVADHRQHEQMADIAADILAQAPPRFALAGLSMGGYIAVAMLRQAPQRVVKLALLDTSARPDTPEQTAARQQFIGLAHVGKLNQVVDALVPRFLHRDRRSDPELNRIIRDMAADTGAEAFVRQEKAIMSREDARPLLPTIRCPTLVLVGEGDELTPPELSREIAAAVPGSRLVIVPDSGHLSTIEKPDAVNAALAEWLRA
ncbi:MAG TPA: alpha/beta fold hydrolase [Pseudolabrys sp.]|nr:alpha/beta fold hydrolase [Pseudolabrys sp.]